MHFEILGDISDVETFATVSRIREIAGCDEFTDADDGANARELRASGCWMA